jgi:hypothetical protein
MRTGFPIRDALHALLDLLESKLRKFSLRARRYFP